MFIMDIGPQFSFLSVFLSDFGVKVMLTSQNGLGNIAFSSTLEKFEKN